MSKIGKPRTSLGLATLCARVAEDKLSKNTFILELTKIEIAPADYFVICSCDSESQVRAICESISMKCKELGLQPPRTEGLALSRWVLLDFFDVVVHIMLQKIREYYQLEKLWGDAKFYKLTVEGKPEHIKDILIKNIY